MNATARDPGFIAKTLVLARKDLRIESRARDTLLPMLFFSIAVTLLLAFTLPATDPAPEVLAGFLWVTVLFAGLIGFARTFEMEREEGAIDALLLVPLDRSGLFVAKALANLAYLVAVQIFLFPVFALMFGLALGRTWGALLAVTVLVDLGFVVIGTLFASIAAQTRSRELILPILSLPALVPVFIAGVELTSDLLVGRELEVVAARGWFGLLVAFDVIFGLVGALAFDLALE